MNQRLILIASKRGVSQGQHWLLTVQRWGGGERPQRDDDLEGVKVFEQPRYASILILSEEHLCSHETAGVPGLSSLLSKDTVMNKDKMKNLCCNIVQSTTCLCIDLAKRERERERGEIFHMFISRTLWDKQPSLSQSLLLLKAQPAQVIKILPSQGEITLCLVAKAQS